MEHAVSPRESAVARIDLRLSISLLQFLGNLFPFFAKLFLRPCTQGYIEHWSQKETKQCHTEHSREDSNASRCANFAAGAVSQEQWNRTGNKRNRGHHDRTQTHATGFERSFHNAFALKL